jgi:carbon-monoxide dehydrogenase medium subunit
VKRFEYFEPATLDETVALLGRYNGHASVLAGGTDLLVEIKEQLRAPDYVINIKKIPGLDHLTYDDEAGLRFGALVTAREIETTPVVRQKYPGLAQAVVELGSIQVRHRATVAGNLCRASPSADTPPPLIAARASVRIFGPDGERIVLLEDFFTGPGQTVLARDELLIELIVPPPPPHTGQVYLKHGRRRAMELATVGVAVMLTLERDVCREVRIVLGAVAPTPIRARSAEDILRHQTITDDLIDQAAKTAMREARPISDVRSSAAYRREMVKVLTTRAVQQSRLEASSQQWE